jgi:hypothetical protein
LVALGHHRSTAKPGSTTQIGLAGSAEPAGRTIDANTAAQTATWPGAQLVRVIGKVRPTAFFGVPRVREKIRAGIQALLGAEQDEGKRAAAQQATETGRRYVASRHGGG